MAACERALMGFDGKVCAVLCCTVSCSSGISWKMDRVSERLPSFLDALSMVNAVLSAQCSVRSLSPLLVKAPGSSQPEGS